MIDKVLSEQSESAMPYFEVIYKILLTLLINNRKYKKLLFRFKFLNEYFSENQKFKYKNTYIRFNHTNKQ